ncbi:MAG: leucine-rich repeat domain-containing protein, partial [Sulfurovum sp.]|uniref:leucine-rich repeat domain-containing protein n=1 Tax=Sulfurovum sp. TaxID=1969726 RepID=UPI003C70D92F
MNGSVMEKIAICKAERMPYLDLSHLGLSEIPPEVGSLVWLERLSLSGNHISDLSALTSLTKIHKLSLSH